MRKCFQIMAAGLLTCLQAAAQPRDSLFMKPKAGTDRQVSCGVSADYFKSLARNQGPSPSLSPSATLAPSGALVSPTVTCGKFQIYYEDVASGIPGGFNDPSSGADRRDLLCQVLTYVQSVIKMDLVPAGSYVRIYVDKSYSSSFPAPGGTGFYAQAGPYYISGTTGVVNGRVHDFIVSGIDPSPGDYHGALQVNFDKVFKMDDFGAVSTTGTLIPYYEGTGSTGRCQIDLYSTLLHEVTHILGWASLTSVFPSTTPATVYSSIDTAIHYSNPKSGLTPLYNGYVGGLVKGTPGHNIYWANGQQAPHNHPVFMSTERFTYTEWATSFAHLDDDLSSYTYKQRHSPGDWQEYVMAPHAHEGTTRRTYTKGETEILRDVLGYTYTPAFGGSAAGSNHTAWSGKMSSPRYDSSFSHFTGWYAGEFNFTELLKADTVIRNDSSASWTLVLASDTSLHDADGDPLMVYPGSLINFRGCGVGGNNHAALSVSSDGKSITYTPRHNYMGKAIFGFNLWDGKEKGGFVMYFVDVTKGNNVSALPGENLVLNGDFEEGSEVKTLGAETIDNSSFEYGSKTSRLRGAHFSDCHPNDYYMNAWMPYGGGTAIRNATVACDMATTVAYGFGGSLNAFPNPVYPYPNPKGNAGNRYQPIRMKMAGFFLLADSLKPCRRYVLELDVYHPAWTLAHLVKSTLEIGFSDTAKAKLSKVTTWDRNNDYELNYKIKPKIPLSFDSDWKHLRIPFTYCADTASDLLILLADDLVDSYMLMDNLSIVEDTNLLAVTIIDSAYLPCGNTRLRAATANVGQYTCLDTAKTGLHYTWTANGDTISHDTMIYVLPHVSTTYIASVTDGCTITRDTIVLAPAAGPIVHIGDTTVCLGDSVTLAPVVTGTTGTVSYSWTPATGLSCTSCAAPKASPSDTTTYTLTVTDAVSCYTQPVTVFVLPLPEFTVSGSDVCAGHPAALEVKAETLYRYQWLDAGMFCDTCLNTLTQPLLRDSFFLVKGTNAYGCSVTDTAFVRVRPLPLVRIEPSDTSICIGDMVHLVASGAIDYRWEGDVTGLSCFTCPDPWASPVGPKIYIVRGMGMNGCIAHDTARVIVRPLPVVVASPKNPAVCQYSPLTMTATGAASYSWTPTPTSCPSCASTTTTVITSMDYVVTGTDPWGCKGRDTVRVTALPVPSVSVSPTTATACTGDSAVLTASGALTYSWSPAIDLSCTTCNPVKAAAPASSRTYTVTGTAANGCTAIASATVTKGACACTPLSVFGATATTLSGSAVSGTFGSGYYYVPANITITGTTNFNGAKMLIGPGVTITVARNALLTVDNSHLFTCPDSGKMWRGIVLEGSTTATPSGRIEVRNNSMIEDALWAIDAINMTTPPSGDIIKVTNSVFNRNQVDISMNGYAASSVATYPFTFTGNVFTSRLIRSSNFSGYPIVWPTAASLRKDTTVIDATPAYVVNRRYPKVKCKDTTIFSLVAIRAIDMGYTNPAGTSFSEIVIGSSSSVEVNMFDNHAGAIQNFRSNMSVYNGLFINISRRMTPSSSTVLPVENGIAVFGVNNPTLRRRLRVMESLNQSNRFFDCFEALYAERFSDLTVRNNIITSSHVMGAAVPGAAYPTETDHSMGILVHGGYNQRVVEVTGNRISNIPSGIVCLVDNPVDGAITKLDGNFMYGANPDIAVGYTTNQYMRKAILTWSNSIYYTPNTLSASYNTIRNVSNGIEAFNFKGTKASITNDSIVLKDMTASSTDPQYAIRILNTDGAKVSDNRISVATLGPVGLADRIKGVYAAMNTTLKICGNTTTNIGRGFEFAQKTAQTGTRWVDNTMTNGWKGMLLGSDIGDQGLTYDWRIISPVYYGATLNKWVGFGGTKYHTVGLDYTNTMLSKLYVKNLPTGVAQLPTSNTSIPGAGFPYFYRMTGTAESIIIAAGQRETNCDGAFYPVKVNPMPRPSTSIGIGKTLGLLVLADSLGYGAPYRAAQWMAQLSLYELGYSQPDLRDSSDVLDQFMIQAAGSRFGWITNVQQALETGNTTLAANLLMQPAQAMGRVQVNNDLVITDYIEANAIAGNYYNYFTAYLHWLTDAMDATDSVNLELLSGKCPATDGAVVYQARGLYNCLLPYPVSYNDDSCEYKAVNIYKALAAQATGQSNAYQLYPNPNSGSFTLQYRLLEGGKPEAERSVKLKVYNALGQQVYTTAAVLAHGKLQVQLNHQLPGLYLLYIDDGIRADTCIRFIVQ
jgi:hypothetical protein